MTLRDMLSQVDVHLPALTTQVSHPLFDRRHHVNSALTAYFRLLSTSPVGTQLLLTHAVNCVVLQAPSWCLWTCTLGPRPNPTVAQCLLTASSWLELELPFVTQPFALRRARAVEQPQLLVSRHWSACLSQCRHHVSYVLVPCLPFGCPCIGLMCLLREDPPDARQCARNGLLHLLQHGVCLCLLDAQVTKHSDPVVQHQSLERHLPQLIVVATDFLVPSQSLMQLHCHILQFRRPATHQLLHTLLCAPVSDAALCVKGPRQSHYLLRIV